MESSALPGPFRAGARWWIPPHTGVRLPFPVEQLACPVDLHEFRASSARAMLSGAWHPLRPKAHGVESMRFAKPSEVNRERLERRGRRVRANRVLLTRVSSAKRPRPPKAYAALGKTRHCAFQRLPDHSSKVSSRRGEPSTRRSPTAPDLQTLRMPERARRSMHTFSGWTQVRDAKRRIHEISADKVQARQDRGEPRCEIVD